MTTTPPPLRERIAALRHAPRLLRMVWETHRGYALAILLLRLARSGVPVASLWTARLILDALVAATRGTGSAAAVWRYLAIEVAVVVAGDLLARLSTMLESLLADLFSLRLNLRMMEHAATLDLAQFEDPAFQDQLERAQQQTTGRIALLTQLLTTAQDLLTLATYCGALLVASPWLGALLVVSVLPTFAGESHFVGLQYSLLYRRTPQRRQLSYLRWVGVSTEAAKEVRLFGLAGWLADRYRRLADDFYAENAHLTRRRALASSALALVGTAGYYTAYVLILRDGLRGALTVGQLTFLAGAFARSRDIVQRLLAAANEILQQCLYVRDLFTFFALRPHTPAPVHPRPLPRPIRTGFAFEDVGFQYPGTERWILRHLDLRLRPGECVALVGENGAGKTTITKLLTRLYDPTEGRITLDGVDLRAYDAEELRRLVAVVFQDFVRYDMRFDENIGIGHIDAARSYIDGPRRELARSPAGIVESPAAAAVPECIRDAAQQSLAATLLPRFPAGYRQMLGRLFEGGISLSGGEWQKVALARAYARESQLVILDEPTAALDARAEHEVFERFANLMIGRMGVLISHRLLTVRMAHRVIVLDNGTVSEQGTHDELLARGGLYAELFTMQAAGYR